MPKLNVVLIEPQIPQNTGNISRTCAVTGAALHLVRPLGFDISDRQLRRAGLDYWSSLDVSYYDGLEDFFSRRTPKHCFYFTTKAAKNHASVVYPEDCYLIFGREDKGLPENLLMANAHNCVRIPMRNSQRSLNLSNAVAIGVYETLRQWDFEGLEEEGMLSDRTHLG